MPTEPPSRGKPGMMQGVAKSKTLLLLFERDVKGALIAFRHFKDAEASLKKLVERSTACEAEGGAGVPSGLIGAAIHHAASFVCSVHRARRLLEAMCGSEDIPAEFAEFIRLEWRKKRTFFEGYRGARNAIEHIGDKATNAQSFCFYNLVGDTLHVANGARAPITDEAAGRLKECRDRIREKATS